ncbi:hypothetical protein B0O80DRAFT_172939 [Mortierella sp. GBAus27b]|nr:hypothetical protein B0O80DRAFT_172939 [Mortierella sp. GBAus27b]
MSELISQIRVECPHKMFGCAETMEMQQALQHSRDKCQFRLVMCARPRCGQWMRADQIVDHLLMVDPTATSTTTRVGSSNSNSSVSSPTSARSSASSVRSSGRGVSGVSHRKVRGGNARSMNRSLRNQRQSSHGRQSSVSHQQTPETMTTSNKGEIATKVQPCPGLSWEREQLARATGIIGQLTEENSSLRQMIRQLSLQNSKLQQEPLAAIRQP